MNNKEENKSSKPSFEENEMVAFDMGVLSGSGRIRGKSWSHIIDFWIVEVIHCDQEFPTKDYPWTCVAMPHPSLRKIRSDENPVGLARKFPTIRA